MPKVSVIVPVYGVEKYIERCARSLFEQTLDDIEYIFVDDCTPDCSMEILYTLIQEYRPRIVEMNYNVRIEKMPTNSGQAAVRRHGIQLAKGDYIIHCDSDDWVDRDMYRQMYEKAVEEDADLVVVDIACHNGYSSTKILNGCNKLDNRSFVNDMLFQNITWSLCNKLFKSSIYGYITTYPTDNMGEDMALVMQMAVNCRRVSYVYNVYYYYFDNPTSICHSESTSLILSRCQQYLNNFNVVEGLFKLKDQTEIYHKGLNWIRYSIRSMLYVHNEECRHYRKYFFPGIQYRVLLYSNLNLRRRFDCLKNIVKDLIHY